MSEGEGSLLLIQATNPSQFMPDKAFQLLKKTYKTWSKMIPLRNPKLKYSLEADPRAEEQASLRTNRLTMQPLKQYSKKENCLISLT